MELDWLEDFLMLVDCGNFSRAAEQRHLTQPAFSRRIRALEEWLGAPLFTRNSHGVALTVAGDYFRQVADDTLRRLSHGREIARQAGDAADGILKFASTHALSLTFFPVWLRSLEAKARIGGVHLMSDTMLACERIMLQGRANFLLCHYHPAAPIHLDANDFSSLVLGHDVLLPVTAPDEYGLARHELPGSSEAPANYLAFSQQSGMGRIIAAVRAADGSRAHLLPVFTSDVATVLKAMAKDGRGLTWTPLSLLNEDLQSGELVRAGDESWDVPVELRLFRPRSLQPPHVEKFWALLSEN